VVKNEWARIYLPLVKKGWAFTTDGHHDYPSEILKVYCEPCVKYGQILKEKKNGVIIIIIKHKFSMKWAYQMSQHPL